MGWAEDFMVQLNEFQGLKMWIQSIENVDQFLVLNGSNDIKRPVPPKFVRIPSSNAENNIFFPLW
jgi:hypothetical protein